MCECMYVYKYTQENKNTLNQQNPIVLPKQINRLLNRKDGERKRKLFLRVILSVNYSAKFWAMCGRVARPRIFAKDA